MRLMEFLWIGNLCDPFQFWYTIFVNSSVFFALTYSSVSFGHFYVPDTVLEDKIYGYEEKENIL